MSASTSMSSETAGAAPKASIVVPSRGGAVRLPHLFSSLRAQTEPSWEAIVVIDGDVDDSESVVAAAGDERIRAIVFPENRGRSAALNTGFAAARGEVLIRCDDDLRPAPDYVASHVECHSGLPTGAIGLYLNKYPATPYARAYGYERDERFRRDAYATDPRRQWRYWAGNVSVTRTTYDRVGEYDTAFRAYGWEDIDWGYRAFVEGVNVRLVPQIETPHFIAATTTATRVTRAFLSGAARRRFEAKHGLQALGDDAGSALHLWGGLVDFSARVLDLRGIQRCARVIDRIADRMPRYTAEKCIALLVESAAKSGYRRGEQGTEHV